MKKGRTKEQRVNSREAVRDALPGTQSQIRQVTGLTQNSVSRWLIYLRKCGEAHISGWCPSTTKGGFPTALYSPGPGADVILAGSPVLSSEAIAERAKVVAKPVVRRIPRRHPLMAMYGAA